MTSTIDSGNVVYAYCSASVLHRCALFHSTRRVRCNYRSQEFTGAAYRLKHHLAGTNKDSESCKLVLDDVKKAMEDIVYGLQKKLLKKNCIDVEGVVVEVEVATNSNGKRKSVREIARKDMFKRGVTTLIQTTINGT
ncbi:hypothetical protein TSUD_314720 [Trifolium subterraneum]|uniref:BED-type domain-containing protein n=1 Tax=Trifolium subterraneum TaxID=3900 RepID=A0A2Z6MST3_TRISU|nr:hypothetical protein TSUD_314720 [Trifolium subterraneum]